MAIINFYGVQLDVIDNADGAGHPTGDHSECTFNVEAVDPVADKQAIRDEIARLREERDAAVIHIGVLNGIRDFHAAKRTEAVEARTDRVAERDAHDARIAELRAFLLSANDPDPGN